MRKAKLTPEQTARRLRRELREARKALDETGATLVGTLAEVDRLNALLNAAHLQDPLAVPESAGQPVNWGVWDFKPADADKVDWLAREALRRCGHGEVNYVILDDRMVVTSKARRSGDVRRFLCRIEKFNYTFDPTALQQAAAADEEG